jgi:regulator of sirC expression with transglutaminase-like and TPR domain
MPPMDGHPDGQLTIRTATPAGDEARILALITLLGDDDPRVGDAISGHLRDIGPAAVPALREVARNPDPAASPALGARAQALLDDLGREAVLAELSAYGRRDAVPLEPGLVLLARLHTPELEPAACATPLNRMAEDLMMRLDPGDGVDALIHGLARYLHDEQGFSGNTEDYYDVRNSYLHTVLETRKGIPITLSCLYLLLAERLGLPFYGVGMPSHFLVRYDDGHDVRVVDPYNRGRILDRSGCAALLTGVGVAYDDRYLEPVPNRYTLERVVKNLIAIFADKGEGDALALHQRALDALRGATPTD